MGSLGGGTGGGSSDDDSLGGGPTDKQAHQTHTNTAGGAARAVDHEFATSVKEGVTQVVTNPDEEDGTSASTGGAVSVGVFGGGTELVTPNPVQPDQSANNEQHG